MTPEEQESFFREDHRRHSPHFPRWGPSCGIRQHAQLQKIGSKLADAVLAEKWKYAQRLAAKYREASAEPEGRKR